MPRNPNDLQAIADAKATLKRMQDFDVAVLPRRDELGKQMNFADAVDPARRLIDLYAQLPVESLDNLPAGNAGQIHNQASSDFNLLKQILDFDPATVSDPGTIKKNYVQSLWNAYDPAFQVLHFWISFSVRKSTDFSKLEREARSVVQRLNDEAVKLRDELAASQKEANTTLEHIRKTAAEQGVSQQAIWFKASADSQAVLANGWLKATIVMMAVFFVFAVASFGIHKLPFLSPTNAYETVQIAVSKGLVFALLSFSVYLCGRNYQAAKHNYIVNKHRQDALATFNALVDAASSTQNKEIVLNHASACIFSPQPTGYARDGGGTDAPSAKSVVELLGPLTK